MRHSSWMKSLITKMAAERGIDLAQAGLHFKATSTFSGIMDLVVEGLGRNQVSVAHYYEQNGDLCADPEVVFWVCPLDGNWYAIEWSTPPVRMFGRTMGGYQKVLWLDDAGTAWTKARVHEQADLAVFANKWSTNLRRQKFS